MAYEDFIAKCLEIANQLPEQIDIREGSPTKWKPNDYHLIESWVVGSSNPEDEIQEKPDKFTALDFIILATNPQLPVSKYWQALRELVEIKEYTDNDYYDNYVEYNYYSIRLEDLWLLY